MNDEKSFVLRELRNDIMQPKSMAVLLDEQLTKLLNIVAENAENNGQSVDILGDQADTEAESPSLTPNCYVTKWVDYSDKYGLGYQLADGSIGVIFNDSSKITLDRAMQ